MICLATPRNGGTASTSDATLALSKTEPATRERVLVEGSLVVLIAWISNR
jgi:hypothetical protein